MVNLVLFILGTRAGLPEYSERAGNVAEKDPITFKLFSNPWNYLCQPEYMVPGHTAGEEQQVCFSVGDGTPCKTGGTGGIPYGICIDGTCTADGDACSYLAENYPAHFGSERPGGTKALDAYRCMDPPLPPDENAVIVLECLKQKDLCQDSKQKCCGEVQVVR
jgi:hypothetical protein